MNRAAELDAYFDRVGNAQYAGHLRSEVNLLDRTSAKKMSDLFGQHPTIQLVGGVVLDDPETSNHHIFATKSPVAGQVLFLSHDGDTRIVFASLDEFVDAAERAVNEGRWLSDLHPLCSPLTQDQKGLSELIRHLCSGNRDEDTALELIPSLDLSDVDLLEYLAAAQNFFLAEAVAVEIAKRPRKDLLSVAELCSAHPHPQAGRAGSEAVRAIHKGLVSSPNA